MEEQRKNKSHRINISTGGGSGIAGLLVLGGALAITGLMAVAVFATNMNKNKKKGSQVPQESDHVGSKTEDEESEAIQGKGLRSLLHEDSTTAEANACCTTHATPEISINQINNSTDLLSVQTMILEEKPDLKTSNEESSICPYQEIVLSDDSQPGSAVSESLNDNEIEEEDMDKTETQGITYIEIIENQNENATPEAETQDNYDDDEEEFDDSVESSEATGRTSLDSNEEPIWPAELIEEPHKAIMVNLQSPQEEVEKAVATPETTDDNGSTEIDSADGSKSDCVGNRDYRDMIRETEFIGKTNLYAALDDHGQPKVTVRVSHQSNTRIWIASLLLLAMLLFLLAVFSDRSPLSSYFLHGTSVVDVVP
ncbi:hypothetical protein L6164_034724 [Bauhinia variegata]|uniref:Uncharacterized protein n=1 Tax=Bauhinia variegata TaxID=167791 RepID=A0ACB9KVU4_BAUVA|nr:hypothetical protein L6164_034724 [Bauhinia variegata]